MVAFFSITAISNKKKQKIIDSFLINCVKLEEAKIFTLDHEGGRDTHANANY